MKTMPKYLIKKRVKFIIIAAIVFLGFIFLAEGVKGMASPSAVYCQELGYKWTIKKTEEGEIGICEFPDGSSCSDWEFLKGRCGQEYSYCHQKGYQLKTLSDDKKCASIFSKDCAVCVLSGGEEVEVSTLMKTEKEALSTKKAFIYKIFLIAAITLIVTIVTTLGILIYRRIKKKKVDIKGEKPLG